MSSTLVDGGVYKIISEESGLILTLYPFNDGGIRAFDDRDVENQKWLAEKATVDRWTLKSLFQYPGYLAPIYLDYYGLVQGSRLGSSVSGRQWLISEDGGSTILRAADSPTLGLLADLYNASHAVGTVIQLWENNDTKAQRWLFQPVPAS